MMQTPQDKKRFWLRIVSYILVAVLASGVTLVIVKANTSKLDQLSDLINDRFIGEVDTVAMEDAAAKAMVASLDDRWSYYISASDFAAYQDNKSNSYVGIGITVAAREDNAGFDIVLVEPGGPAQESGILPGDILIEAEGQELAGLDVSSAADMIGGEEGTKVTVTVLRDGERLSFTMKRRRIRVAVAEGELLDGSIGYVKIRNFNDNCAEETIAAIDALVEQGARSLIFDVRYNPGGYVKQLVEVLDYLLPEGVLFRSVRYNGSETVEESDAACLELPMAVLVNGSSYSAAEFFAAALSEYDWATVVGEPTVGKGYFQNTLELKDGSAVGLSVGKYFTPNGVSLADEGGLTPDVTVEVDAQTAALIYGNLLEPAEDPQVQAAIEALQQ